MKCIRKYLFWMTEKGIQTYKMRTDGEFELLRFKGEDIYSDTDFEKFSLWFNRIASIAEDEYIDFCYLSNRPIDNPIFNNSRKRKSKKGKSSWKKTEIEKFCEKHIDTANYEVIVGENKSFVCQSGNIYDNNCIEKIYLKCMPEFSFDKEQKKDASPEETSLVNRYFIDMLKELNK